MKFLCDTILPKHKFPSQFLHLRGKTNFMKHVGESTDQNISLTHINTNTAIGTHNKNNNNENKHETCNKTTIPNTHGKIKPTKQNDAIPKLIVNDKNAVQQYIKSLDNEEINGNEMLSIIW